jgi:hypothetical protein
VCRNLEQGRSNEKKRKRSGVYSNSDRVLDKKPTPLDCIAVDLEFTPLWLRQENEWEVREWILEGGSGVGWRGGRRIGVGWEGGKKDKGCRNRVVGRG